MYVDFLDSIGRSQPVTKGHFNWSRKNCDFVEKSRRMLLWIEPETLEHGGSLLLKPHKVEQRWASWREWQNSLLLTSCSRLFQSKEGVYCLCKNVMHHRSTCTSPVTLLILSCCLMNRRVCVRASIRHIRRQSARCKHGEVPDSRGASSRDGGRRKTVRRWKQAGTCFAQYWLIDLLLSPFCQLPSLQFVTRICAFFLSVSGCFSVSSSRLEALRT